jgi:Rha family phage regulatory protein
MTMTSTSIVTVLRLQEGKIINAVSSKEVATKFNKQHSHVLRSIKEITSQMTNDYKAVHFWMQEKQTLKGTEVEEAFMSRDGFSLVAMSFTGKDALEWKIKFLDAFNAMEAEILKKNQIKSPKKPRMLHTAVFNANSLFADFDKAIGLVELRKIPESEMTGWQKVFSRAYYCTRNYSRMKLKVDTELMPALRTTLIDVFGKPVTDNLIDLVERRKLKTSQPSTQR